MLEYYKNTLDHGILVSKRSIYIYQKDVNKDNSMKWVGVLKENELQVIKTIFKNNLAKYHYSIPRTNFKLNTKLKVFIFGKLYSIYKTTPNSLRVMLRPTWP